MSLESGVRIGPYEILDSLGAGGMGEVYRALDTRLGREVAVKVLNQRMAGDEAAHSRFEREAQAVAALSHPNIVSIFDYGFMEGAPYAVTELLEGETLRNHLSRSQLGWKRAVEIGIDLAAGLAAAHGKGIVHRDLKPENIFICSDGRVKILDFGLARAGTPLAAGEHSTAPTAISETKPGTVLGTVGYMSPEQVRGRPADRRSDLFSLGCVLFEMLTGSRAFAGETASDIMAAILRDSPSAVSESGRLIPLQLDEIIAACLNKDPGLRYSGAEDVGAALKAARETESISGLQPVLPPASRSGRGLRVGLAATALVGLSAVLLLYFLGLGASSKVESVAVLPFQFESDQLGPAESESTLEALSDEVAESIINRLSQASDLRVMAWSSVKDLDAFEDPRKAGEKLGVDAVLTGRVSRNKETVLIQTSLIEVERGWQLWGERFEQPFTQASHFRESVAQGVATSLDTPLPPPKQDEMERRVAANPEAFEHYLKGRYLTEHKKTHEKQLDEWIAEIEEYRKALEMDEKYLPAYGELSRALAAAGLSGGQIVLDSAFPQARDAAVKVLEFDRSNPDAHRILGTVYSLYEWQWEKAGDVLEKALELAPESADNHQRYAMDYLAPTGNLEEATEHMRHAVRIEPESPGLRLDLSRLHYFSRNYEMALKELDRAGKLGPRFVPVFHLRALSLAQLGRTKEAARTLQKAQNLPGRQVTMALRAYLHGLGGDPRLARRLLRAFQSPAVTSASGRAPSLSKLDSVPPSPPPPPAARTQARGRSRPTIQFSWKRIKQEMRNDRPPAILAVYAYLGLKEYDKALEALKMAVDNRDRATIYLDVEPLFDPIRDRPEFERLLERLNLS